MMAVGRDGRKMIRRVAHSIDPITRGWAVVATGSAARLALGFVASILIARSLGPSGFAVFAVLAAASGIAGAVADLGLSDAAVKRVAEVWAVDPAAAQLRGRTFFWLRLGAAALLALAGSLLAEPLSQGALRLSADPTLLVLAMIGVLATALSGATTTLLQATGRFAAITAVLLTNSGLTALLAVGLALAGALNLVTALVILGIGTSLAAFAVARRLLPPAWSLALPDFGLLWSEGTPLLRFGGWLWIGGIFAMLAAQIDLLLLNRWSDAATVGAYGLAVNLAAKVDVANHSLYTVLLPSASALRGDGAVRAYLRRGFLRSVLLSAGLLPLVPLAGPLITLFYGTAYEGAVPLFQLLLGVAIFELVATPFLLLAFTFDRPQLIAGAEATRAATLGIACLCLIPILGPSGAILARFASRAAGAVVVALVLCRRAGRI
jgi:O-antigen/teichoic acid export membrane protein